MSELDSAVISPCGKYRTRLTRGSMLMGTCFFIMLNPSTANALVDDPTIRRCKAFASRLHLGNLVVGNLFTRRATDPADLIRLDDPVGPDAKQATEEMIEEWFPGDEDLGWPRDTIICAWGACHAKWPDWFRAMRQERIDAICDYAAAFDRPLFALGYTSDGSPRHPLYVKSDAALVPFPKGPS